MKNRSSKERNPTAIVFCSENGAFSHTLVFEAGA